MKRTWLLPILTVASTATIITPMVSCTGSFVNDDEYWHGNEWKSPEPQTIEQFHEYTIDIVNVNKRAHLFETTNFWFFITVETYTVLHQDIDSVKYSVNGDEFLNGDIDDAGASAVFFAGKLPSTTETLSIKIGIKTLATSTLTAEAIFHFKDSNQ